MNSEQIVGTIRQFLPFVGGIITALGWNKDGKFDSLANAAIALIGPAMTFGSLVWSLVSKTNAAIVTKAASVPGVASINLQNNAAGAALAPVTPPNVNVTR